MLPRAIIPSAEYSVLRARLKGTAARVARHSPTLSPQTRNDDEVEKQKNRRAHSHPLGRGQTQKWPLFAFVDTVQSLSSLFVAIFFFVHPKSIIVFVLLFSISQVSFVSSFLHYDATTSRLLPLNLSVENQNHSARKIVGGVAEREDARQRKKQKQQKQRSGSLVDPLVPPNNQSCWTR